MIPLDLEEVRDCATSAGLEVELWQDTGTIRLSLKSPWQIHDVAPDWFLRKDGPWCLVGREQSPPLENSMEPSAAQEFPILAQHRAVRIASPEEFVAVLRALLKVGWCVNNDAYLFPEAGNWLAYVSHHNELFLYTPPESASG